MAKLSTGKHNIERLNVVWRDMIATDGLTKELAYRLEKLILRLDSIVDKIFIKTVKAQDVLLECEQLTEMFRSELDKPQNESLVLLTRIENQIEELVKETHAFRIKAG
jgi:hypothetical protein